jgi:hypothetical protein
MSRSEDYIPPAWYADDFETTTDLDSAPEPYELSAEEIEPLENLKSGESRLSVSSRTISANEREIYTVTATRADDGSLTATTRTGRVHVWSWAIAPLESEHVYTGTTIESYVEQAAALGGIHWFHNLRFDGGFLDAYLCELPPVGLGMHAVADRPRSVPPGFFGALISDQGAHYARYVHLTDGRRFEVRDSLKKFPNTTIAALAGMYGAELGKGEIDYTAERPVGYLPTRDEWEYIRRDVDILRTALRVPEALGNDGLTIGGDAMTEYKLTMAHGNFRNIFPILDRDLDEWIRRAYRGGWTYVNPKYQGQILEAPGCVWDVNSMYPAVMRDSSFPVGEPVRLAPGQTELRGYPHVIYGALLDATIKPDHLPMIQVKRDARYDPVAYQTEVRGVEWYGTEVDWALLYDQYDVVIHEWIAGFAFRGISGLFDRYIDKWMEVKKTSKGGMRTQAKFALNNLWGRFGINPLRAGRLPRIGKDGAVTYVAQPQEYTEPSYTPVGVWTTSYGRDRVIRTAQSFGDRFLAADTDSCHVLEIHRPEHDTLITVEHNGEQITRSVPTGMPVHDVNLGAWKLEGIFDRATYLRAKAYAEQIVEGDERHIEAHVAGLPRKLLQGARIEDITVGTRYSGKLVPKRVPGGIILVSTDFAIGERDAWGHRS